MKLALKLQRPRMTLHAETAADLMTSEPIAIAADVTVNEALTLFTDHGLCVAPVTDDAGRPIGVLSSSDILIHQRAQAAAAARKPGSTEAESARPDTARVQDLMTPVVFAVTPGTLVNKVIDEMWQLRLHHVFVVNQEGVLIGVISALDVLNRLGD